MKKVNWTNLTHQLWKENQKWSQFAIKPHFMILCSGGLDSMVLLDILRELSPKWGVALSVLYCHHGGESEYRQQAQDLVQAYCFKYGLEWHCVRSNRELTQEEEMRKFRRKTALQLVTDRSVVLVTAHHQNDLLETRILRLIRGVGPQGLQAMSSWSAPWWRPLLKFEKRELRQEATYRQLLWLEDPSNQQVHYLRNWLRHSWLPQLEDRCPGGVRVLERSLENLSVIHQSESLSIHWQKKANQWRLPLHRWLFLSPTMQNKLLAQVFRSLKRQNYTLGQINEVKSRLLRQPAEVAFSAGGMDWLIKKTWLYARKSKLG